MLEVGVRKITQRELKRKTKRWTVRRKISVPEKPNPGSLISKAYKVLKREWKR